jgi:putative endonuclease
VEQLVARWAHNPKVTSSSLVPATKKEERPELVAFFMFKVYILYSAKYDKIYIGFTADLDSRLLSHNKLATKGWTIRFRPWNLIYTQDFQTKQEAMKREKYLKSFRGREWIRNEVLKK